MCENDDDDGGGGGGGVDDVDGRRAASRLSGRRMVETGLRDRPLSGTDAKITTRHNTLGTHPPQTPFIGDLRYSISCISKKCTNSTTVISKFLAIFGFEKIHVFCAH
ncbi:hypothetical protein RB195_017875 [Necator americanus]|uniref:Uncharacterized protein n=1 Tax=Necator americanus TaxID=51031 RepID=A0ABR1C758_NECAM